ncbi:acyltransferase family protein [Actinoalloteichus hymeniacidonis]|uniref:Acyltransferase n=1 Tax=Actinoalloteichus hymeniacidonis TaxID=340345 RepID=A0AAC9MWC9_9PSEU|nr:acyltransferase [Actinoalloteichus hymeniacidonis]AOS60916.1 putative acyltransferase [Actinoalloteichus hymeniacidonis]MBB5911084.1 peptidoglycan/LPS O-acetylase OafA/YrhL [Actinoalloteichus hymeniacidonis]
MTSRGSGSPVGVSEKPARRYLYGLDLLRVIATMLILFRHLAGWVASNHPDDWLAGALVNGLLAEPLSLNTNLGMMGLTTLFLISGLVVTYVTAKEEPGQFLLRRMARLLPAFWVTVLVFWILIMVGVSRGANQDLLSLAMNIGFIGFVGPLVLAVTWTLSIQLTFYFFTAATLRIGRSHAWLPPVLGAVAIWFVLLIVTDTNVDPAHQIRTIATYLPVLFIGQLISLWAAQRLAARTAIALGLGHGLLFVWAGMNHESMPSGAATERTLLLVVLITLLLLGAKGRFVRSKWIAALAKRSYAIYLVHLNVSYPVLRATVAELGLTLGMIIALLAVAVVTELLYRFVEVPVYNRFRRWESARAARRAGAEQSQRATASASAPPAIGSAGTTTDVQSDADRRLPSLEPVIVVSTAEQAMPMAVSSDQAGTRTPSDRSEPIAGDNSSN